MNILASNIIATESENTSTRKSFLSPRASLSEIKRKRQVPYEKTADDFEAKKREGE